MQAQDISAVDEGKGSRWALFGERRLWFMAAFGFVSGLPLSLSTSTLRQWLTEGHVSLGAIGLTANIGLAYTLKFLWSPLLDQMRPPFGLHRFGRRRGWLLAIQPALVAAVVWLALSDAGAAPEVTVAAAAVVAFFSASQDIVIDAWRIETFPPSLQPAGMATYVWGYRVALLVSGAGAIKSADFVGWHGALLIVACLLALGVLVTFGAPEPPLRVAPPRPAPLAVRVAAAVVEPLREFVSRPGAGLVLAYILLFYLGEVVAGVMLTPFYRSLGFDRGAVAATGLYSLAATILGIAGGVWLIARMGLGAGADLHRLPADDRDGDVRVAGGFARRRRRALCDRDGGGVRAGPRERGLRHLPLGSLCRGLHGDALRPAHPRSRRWPRTRWAGCPASSRRRWAGSCSTWPPCWPRCRP